MTDESTEPKTFTEKEVGEIVYAERKRERRVSALLECIRLARVAGMEQGYIAEIGQILIEVAGVPMIQELTGKQIGAPAPETPAPKD